MRGEDMKCVIYKIENKVNGKVYIGQTKVGFKTRKSSHILSLRKNIHSNDHLQKAWNRYGKNKFDFSILVGCEESELDAFEIMFIELFNSTDRKYGYNYESGGNLKKEVHKETRKKMSKHIVSLWGENWFRKIRQKRVICINTGEVFESLKEASAKTGAQRPNISKCCIGERVYATGSNGVKYQFAYYVSDKEYNLKPIISEPRRKKSVICLNDGEVYKTIKAASETYDIPSSNISLVCKGINMSTFNPDGKPLQFAYYEEGKTYKIKEVKITNYPKRVKCITTGEVFDSMYSAAKSYGISRSYSISRVCNGERKTCGQLPDGTKLEWSYLQGNGKV
jgi:group I intron endonuclease